MGDSRQLEQPIYHQVADFLRGYLIDQASCGAAPLASEESLATDYQVAPPTIRKALQILQTEGLIRSADQGQAVAVPEGILAYRQNRHSRLVLVIGARPAGPSSYYGRILHGIIGAAQEAGYAYACRYLGKSFPERTPQMRPEDPEHVLGVIMIAVVGDDIIAMHTEGGYPIVSVDYWPAHSHADAVITDCFTEGQQAVGYLMSQGHREMFYLGKMYRREPRQEYLYEIDAMQVETGYRYATHMAGLFASCQRVQSFNASQPFYTEYIEQILAEKPRPTAGIIYNLTMAERFRECMRTYDLRCPEDISLLSRYDTLTISEFTALRVDGLRMGRMAMEVLLARVSGRQAPGMRVSVTSELKSGATVARV